MRRQTHFRSPVFAPISHGEMEATHPTPPHDASTASWNARPGLALALRLVSVVLPVAGAIGITVAIARLWPAPAELTPRIGWLATLMVAATIALLLIDRLARRLLPLATLLQMSLIFPDAAPSRFTVALRTGTTRQLERSMSTRMVDPTTGRPLDQTEAEAASALLELVAALSKHDRFTRGHSERVRAYAALIGEELGLDELELSKLQWAALVHDIGKLDVPQEILTKPDALTPEEFEIIKTHPAAGDRMIEPLRPWLGEWADAVGQHHERLDGAGYPAGLRGDQISLAARIISVADTFDVITAARSYKKPMPAELAKQELTRCAGTQFDESIVRAFLSISIGRLRFAMGPLSFFASLPYVGALTAPATSAAAAVIVGTSAALGGGVLIADRLDATPAEVAFVDSDNQTTTPGDALDETTDEDGDPVDIGDSIEPTPNDSVDPTRSTPPTSVDAADESPDDANDSPGTSSAASTDMTTSPTTNAPATTATSTTAPPSTSTTLATTTTIAPCTAARTGQSDWSGADLTGCDLSDLTLDGFSFDGADLTGVSFAGATITNADFRNATMNGVDLSDATIDASDFTGADLRDVVATGATFTDVNLTNLDLTGATFTGVVVTNGSFQGSTLTDGDFSGLTLNSSDLREVEAGGATFVGAQLSGAWMWDANFANADFTSAKLTTADLSRSDLTAAVLVGTALDSSNLDATIVAGADLSGADLWNAQNLPTGAATATWNATKCPNGIVGSTNCYP